MPEPTPRIVAFAGSLRKGSLNRRLLQYAVEARPPRAARWKSSGPSGSSCRSTTATWTNVTLVQELQAIGRIVVKAAQAGIGKL